MATGQWHYPINLHDDSLSGNISANPISRRFRYTQPTATHGGCPAGNPCDTASYALLSLRESSCTMGHSKNNLVAFDLLSLCIPEN